MEKLKLAFQKILYPKAPYSFKHSTRNPTHFPTPTVQSDSSNLWFATRHAGTPIGVHFKNKGTIGKPAVEVTVYTKGKVDSQKLLEELSYRFEWDGDYSEFYVQFASDQILGKPISSLKGMRMFCAESLYEYLMIAILLQNANVKRTTAMTKAMLERYGTLLEFDSQVLYCIWTPEEILNVEEAELRALKVGYRAKSFLRASQDFLHLDEAAMRKLDNESLKKALLAIYSIGPASLDYLLRDVFHRRDALNSVPPWEAKIYSKMLDIKSQNPNVQLKFITKRFGSWRALAIHYLFMDLAWQHKEKPQEWFGKIMPY